MHAEPISAPTVLEVIADRYQVLGRIADGGMGSVYLGRQLELGRRVAIKTLHAHASRHSELSDRFRREAEAVKQLSHPNTVRIYDFGESAGGWLYLVMEYLEGLTLDQVLERCGALSVEVVTNVAVQILKSLIEAHSCGVVHRDLKPSNLMLCRQLGERDFVKVLDFGLARVETGGLDFKTRTGASLGTPHYMSPEQVKGEPLDGRSDLYSLAITLYELVVGQPAYEGATLYEVALQHLKPGVLSLPHELAGTVLGAVIGRASQKRPGDRYQSAADMLRALTGDASIGAPSLLDEMAFTAPTFAVEPLELPGPSRATVDDLDGLARTSRAGRRRRAVWLGRSMGALGLLLGVVAMASIFQRATPGNDAVDKRLEQAASGEEALVEPAPGSLTAPAEPVLAAPDALALGEENAGPGPADVSVRVDSVPTGALVRLDGALLCETPCNEWVAPRGETVVTLERPGFATWTQQVALAADVTVSARLETEGRAERARHPSAQAPAQIITDSSPGVPPEPIEGGGAPTRDLALPVDF